MKSTFNDGPTVSRRVFRTVRFRGVRGARLSSPRRFAHRDFKKQGLAPSHSRTRGRLGDKHVVTARGHLGKKGAAQEGPKVSCMFTEGITVISKCHLIRPRSWFSLGVNEGEKGWLKPHLIH
jgi:hypothetical protein